MHLSTIKATVRKAFPEVKISEVKRNGFGVISVKVTEDRKRSTRLGMLFGVLDNGELNLDARIEWLGSI